jgi:hypothetical protein
LETYVVIIADENGVADDVLDLWTQTAVALQPNPVYDLS